MITLFSTLPIFASNARHIGRPPDGIGALRTWPPRPRRGRLAHELSALNALAVGCRGRPETGLYVTT